MLICNVGDAGRAMLLAAAQTHPPYGLLEFVPAHDTVLFLFRNRIDDRVLNDWIHKLPKETETDSGRCRHHTVPVIYDGPDLEAVANTIGAEVSEVIQLHSALTYDVRMMGFAPGFPYLEGLHPRLQLPRRTTPRTHIEPGTVAIGGPHAGIYSVASPGGWHLLGRTNLQLFCKPAADATPPLREVFPLHPGDTVTFKSVDAF